MKILNVKYLVAILLIALFYSCEYEPKEIYELDLETKEPEFTDYELDFNLDTLYLYYNKNINFSFATKEHDIRNVQLIVGESIISEHENWSDDGNNITGSVRVSIDDFQEGEYKMKFLINVSSSTGSLGDQLGAEGYQYYKEWTLIVIKDIGKSSFVDSTIVKNNLNLNWEEYTKPDFVEYSIKKRLGYDVIETYTSDVPFFEDPNYIGEHCSYVISIKRKSGIDYNWGSIEIWQTLPEIFFTTNEKNEYIISCTNSVFFSNAEVWEVYQRNSEYDYDKIAEFTDTENEYLISDFKFLATRDY